MRRMSIILVLAFVGCASTKSLNRASLIQDGETQPAPRSENTVQVAPKRMKITSATPRKKADPEDVVVKANQDAKRDPFSDGYFNSAMVYDWEPNSLYQVYASPLRVTDIVLEQMEHITSISGGDTTRWQVEPSTSGTGPEEVAHVIIKPLRSQIQTNLIIMTNRRTYHLEVHSLQDGNYMASVKWNYPRPMISQSQTDDDHSGAFDSLSNADLDFGYHFVAKDKPIWMPVRVFDDGKKTYIEFPREAKSREMPALFVLSKRGNPQVVNYRVVGSFYILDQLVDLMELRLGGDDAEVVGIERL